ncbi:hypothetical protein [Pseudoduganella sp. OTU4001]|uniref:hypothetical protein n=1 Tax=Pseudoduganella sp. OTU4001 TaxID=3043854 RepID=UPI00313B1C02
MMPLLTGVLLALATAIGGWVVGFTRERGFFPVVLIVIATYNLLFAVMADSPGTLRPELDAAIVFLALAVAGYKRSLWLVALGLFAHGVFDAFHGRLIANPGVPEFWPAFCAGYDLAFAACLSLLLASGAQPPSR